MAALDCGTNTLKLLVADLDPASGAQRDLAREYVVVRLGQAVDGTGRIGEEALARLSAAAHDLMEVARGLGAHRVAVGATSAVRDATNADEALALLERLTGARPVVLSGVEEATLAFAGATRCAGGLGDEVLVVDVGGGSTELARGRRGGEPGAVCSLDVGTVRLTERWLHHDPPTAGEIASAVADTERALDSRMARTVLDDPPDDVVLTSGTAMILGAGALGLPRPDPARLHRTPVSVEALRATCARVLSMTAARRRSLGWMAGREQVIGAGAVVLDRLSRRLEVPTVTISVADLLDALAWRALGQDVGETREAPR